MSNVDIEVWVEPIEQYLRDVICADKLALYQQAIDIFKTMQRLTFIENLNSICNNLTYESPSEVVDEVHRYTEQYVIDLLGEFDIVAVGGDLSFLITILDLVHRLDAYDDHETLVNTLRNWTDPLDALFLTLNILSPIDEDQYYDSIKLCSMSMIEQTILLHQAKLNEILADDLSNTQNIPLTKLLISKHRNLIIAQMFEDNAVSVSLPANAVTMLAKPYFTNIDTKVPPKQVALELIGVYSLTGLVGDELIETIKEYIQYLIGDDQHILLTLGVLGSTYVEVQS